MHVHYRLLNSTCKLRSRRNLQGKLEVTESDVPGLARFQSLEDTILMGNTVLCKDCGANLRDVAQYDVGAERRDQLERCQIESLAVFPDHLGLVILSVVVGNILADIPTSIVFFHSLGLSLVMGSIMRSDRIDHLCVFVRDVGSTLAS